MTSPVRQWRPWNVANFPEICQRSKISFQGVEVVFLYSRMHCRANIQLIILVFSGHARYLSSPARNSLITIDRLNRYKQGQINPRKSRREQCFKTLTKNTKHTVMCIRKYCSVLLYKIRSANGFSQQTAGLPSATVYHGRLSSPTPLR